MTTVNVPLILMEETDLIGIQPEAPRTRRDIGIMTRPSKPERFIGEGLECSRR